METQEKKEKLPASMIKEKLLIKNDRTIERYIREGALPQPVQETHDGEMLFDKQEILQFLGVQTLEEEFIDAQEAGKILGIKRVSVLRCAREGRIPYYELKKPNSTKLLFLRSEIEAANKNTIQWSGQFANRVGKDRAMKSIFDKLLNTNLELLSVREALIVRMLIVEDKSMKETADKFDLTTFRVKQIFGQVITKLNSRLHNLNEKLANVYRINSEMDALQKKLAYYEKKERELNAVPHAIQQLFMQELSNFHFSVRVTKCFRAAGLVTIGDLAAKDKNDMMKFRDIGRGSLKEMDDFLRSKGLKWKMKF